MTSQYKLDLVRGKYEPGFYDAVQISDDEDDKNEIARPASPLPATVTDASEAGTGQKSTPKAIKSQSQTNLVVTPSTGVDSPNTQHTMAYKFSRMPFKASTSYGPMNTLNQDRGAKAQKPSSKTDMMYEKRYSQQSVQNQRSTLNQYQSSPQQYHPLKRSPRTLPRHREHLEDMLTLNRADQSPTNLETTPVTGAAISLNNSNERAAKRQRLSAESVSSSDWDHSERAQPSTAQHGRSATGTSPHDQRQRADTGSHSLGRPNVIRNGVKHTALRELQNKNGISEDSRQARAGKSPSPKSDTFTQDAARERRSRRSPTAEAIDLQSMFSAGLTINPPKSASHQPLQIPGKSEKAKSTIAKGYHDASADELELVLTERAPQPKDEKRKNSKHRTFPLACFATHKAKYDGAVLLVVLRREKMSICRRTEEGCAETVLLEIKISKVIRIDGSRNGKHLVLHTSKSVDCPTQTSYVLRFKTSRDCCDFAAQAAKAAGIRLGFRSEDYLEKVMANLHLDEAREPHRPDMSAGSVDKDQQPTTKHEPGRPLQAKTRLIDNLDAPQSVGIDVELDNETPDTPGRRPELIAARSAVRTTRSSMMGDKVQARKRKSSPISGGREADELSTAAARIDTRRKSAASTREAYGVSATPEPSIPRRTGKPWKTPLVYPKAGAQKVTVSWEDLARLEDEEYLNDSLVAFFIRYLQEQYPVSAKNMHFFSSFFYEKLTQVSKSKSSPRHINYSGVASWTKKVGIFTRDYIIVPVNENAHWYVMIVCNPKALVNPEVQLSGDEAPIDQIETSHNPPDESSSPAHGKMILKSDITVDDLSDEDNSEEQKNISPPASHNRPRGRRFRREPSRKKYALDKPVIVALDSLNTARSPTATNLKDYLIQEAQEKRGITITRDHISGMTAKKIPLQDNFVDCGLYLCMYLEKFMVDPAKFTTSVLQRDEEGLQWPAKVKSATLRQRFYELLVELHDEQENGSDPKSRSLQSVLICEEDCINPETQENVKKLQALSKAQRYINDNQQRPRRGALQAGPSNPSGRNSDVQISSDMKILSDNQAVKELMVTIPNEEQKVKSPYFDKAIPPASFYTASAAAATKRPDLRPHSIDRTAKSQKRRRTNSPETQLAVHQADLSTRPMADIKDKTLVELKDDYWQGFDDRDEASASKDAAPDVMLIDD